MPATPTADEKSEKTQERQTRDQAEKQERQPKQERKMIPRDRDDNDEPTVRYGRAAQIERDKELDDESEIKDDEPRWITVQIELIAKVTDDTINTDAVELATLDQVIFPTYLSGYGAVMQVVGGNVKGVSESKEPVKYAAGFGRAGAGELEGAPAKNQERISPPEAVVGELAVIRAGEPELEDEPAASPETTVNVEKGK